jgi:hypothetical protein
VPANSPGVVDIDRLPTETDAWQHIKKMVTAEGPPRCGNIAQNKHVATINDPCSSIH